MQPCRKGARTRKIFIVSYKRIGCRCIKSAITRIRTCSKYCFLLLFFVIRNESLLYRCVFFSQDVLATRSSVNVVEEQVRRDASSTCPSNSTERSADAPRKSSVSSAKLAVRCFIKLSDNFFCIFTTQHPYFLQAAPRVAKWCSARRECESLGRSPSGSDESAASNSACESSRKNARRSVRYSLINSRNA